ncbi:MAG: hypothetical protein GY928_02020 [Colwellia sp.]|nr:hypothetical protein [Colwellia sp.]
MIDQLIPMVDYIIETDKGLNNELEPILTSWNDVVEYAKFLKQPLKLEMFIPCDDDGNLLEKDQCKCQNHVKAVNCNCFNKYHQALDKVLFKGFVLDDDEFRRDGWLCVSDYNRNRITFSSRSLKAEWGQKTIEDLVGLGIELKNTTNN